MSGPGAAPTRGQGDAPERADARSVLAINRGSSSVKFGLFTLGDEPAVLARGSVNASAPDDVVGEVLARLSAHVDVHPVCAIGHRLVHGGPQLSLPALVTDAVLATLRQLVPFAPNHLPDEIALIEAAGRGWPGVTQFVCVDTAFHTSMPDVARRLAIPQEYDAQGIRRYGFHGLSFTFLLAELGRRAGPRAAAGRVVLMHLGSGSSLAAVDNGRSIDTSMGFTPLGGVVMSTRSGDLDPGVVVQMARLSGLDPDGVEHELSHRSGLAGISGTSGDMQDLLAREEDSDACRLAVAIYCYEIRKKIGAYAAALGGLDALVFSGGIGEHAPPVRARICAGLEFLGIQIDGSANEIDAPLVSTVDARVPVHVIPTDEEAVIASAALPLLTRHP